LTIIFFLQLMGAAPDCPELKTVILMEEPTDEERLAAEAINLRLLWFQDVVQDGKSRPVTIDPPTPDDLYRCVSSFLHFFLFLFFV
jgi:hypothetical protein